MKNKTKTTILHTVLVSGLIVSSSLVAQASETTINTDNTVAYEKVAATPFTDVEVNHYAYDAIVWGKAKSLISGYTNSKGEPNGMYGPDDDVTEAQFVKMVATYFGLKDDAGDLSKKGMSKGQLHWADSHYDALAKHGAPLHGYFNNTLRDQTINRGTVAQVLGYLMGDTSSLEGSIHYLLDNGITKGQNPQFEGQDLNLFFGSTNNLSRSQIIVFLHRIETNSLNKLGQGSSAYAEVNHDLNSKANSASGMLDSSLSSNSTTSTTNGTGNGLDINTPGGNGNIITGPAESPDTVDYIEVVKGYLSSDTKNYIDNKGYKWDYANQKGAELLTSSDGRGNYFTLNIFNKSYQSKVIAIDNDYELLARVLNDYFGTSFTGTSLKNKVLSIRNTSANQEVVLVDDVYCYLANNGMDFYRK